MARNLLHYWVLLIHQFEGGSSSRPAFHFSPDTSDVAFQKGTARTPEDACTIQRYNGGGQFVIYWKKQNRFNARQLGSKHEYASLRGFGLRTSRIETVVKANTLGSHIMLHGFGGSSGCIAISDLAMEEIFWLTANVGIENTSILIYSHDFRLTSLPENITPHWLQARYKALHAALLEPAVLPADPPPPP